MKKLLAFSFPLVLANLLQEFYAIVDLMVIGKFADSIGTVGVSIGGEIADMLTPVAMAFAMAGQIYIAQLTGAEKKDDIKKAVGTVITLMLVLSVVASIGVQILCYPLLYILNCPAEAANDAASYLRITAVGVPFIFGYNAVCGVLRGMGDSRRPFLFVLTAAGVNIVLDILLVAAFEMGVAGTAYATVIAQIGACSAAFVFLYMRREQFGITLDRKYFRIHQSSAKIILRLGIPRALQSCCIRFSLLWCNANINTYGLTASAANSIGNRIQKLLTTFVSAVDTGAGSMVGQNLGAKKYDRARKVVWSALILTLGVATVASILSLMIPHQLFSIFTNDPKVKELGVIYLRIMVITFYLAALLGSFQSIVTGVGFASFGLVISIMDGVICRIGFSLIFVNILGMGVEGYFLGHAMARSFPIILVFAYFLSGRWVKRKLLIESEKQD